MKGWFDGRGREKKRKQLEAAFPGKSPLAIQTDLFAERRAKALDAYLQILVHLLREEKETEGDGILKDFDFFKVTRAAKETEKQKQQLEGNAVRTPNGLNYGIERLRSNLMTDFNSITSADFESLKGHVRDLQERREGATAANPDDLRCIDQFYALKREWEIERIKRGQFTDDSFSFESKKSIIKSEANENTKQTLKITSSTSVHTLELDSFKNHLRGQESILTDLAVTLKEQKKISQEICAEVLQHNKVIENVEKKQDGTLEGFKESGARVRKLQ